MGLGLRRRKPYNKSTGRDYAYDTRYESTPQQKRNRAARNAARRRLLRKGVVHKGDGRDVDHKVPLSRGGTNRAGNVRVIARSVNRGFKRTSRNKPVT